MRNRRPRLKREPRTSDLIAEEIRKIADGLELRIGAQVIPYERDSDMLDVTVRKQDLKRLTQAIRDEIIPAWVEASLTYTGARGRDKVWINIQLHWKDM